MSLDIWLTAERPTEIFSGNYTGNVCPMWLKAGVYDALYNSADRMARDIVEVLEAGLADMESKPEEYKALNPPNGWGDYEGAMKFLKDFMIACKDNPDAIIGTWK